MPKNAVVILLIVLAILLIFLLVFGFVILPILEKQMVENNATTTTPPNTTTTPNNTTTTTNNNTSTPPNNNTPTVSTDIKELATRFKEAFSWWGSSSNRCGVIGDTNKLNDSDLAKMNSYYKASNGLSLKEEMDNAWVWCATNTVDTTLYNRLT